MLNLRRLSVKSDVRPSSCALWLWTFEAIVCCTPLFAPCAGRPALAALARKTDASAADACNPKPADNDITLPMPCGLSIFSSLWPYLPRACCGTCPCAPAWMTAPIRTGPTTTGVTIRPFLAPLPWMICPAAWRKQAPQGQNYFYLVAKYEVSNLQWHAVMDSACPNTSQPGAEAARPATDVSWYDAVDFTRRYTTWLLQNAPDSLPRFAGDQRNVGFVRLPTETEWNTPRVADKPLAASCCCRKTFLPCP